MTMKYGTQRWLLVFLLCISTTLTADSAKEKRSSIDPFSNLTFLEAPFTGHRLAASEVLNVLEMFSAYSQGVLALPRYHEPIATRGSKGVALFRSFSPAVTLVVVGNDQQVEGLGTGALIRGDGYVLTNWHVIAGHGAAVVFLKPASSAEVKDAQAYGARVIFQDSTADLALLKLIRNTSGAMPTISVANMSAVQVAEDVHIIGHPHGELWSYSTGVISQIRNDYEWQYSDGSKHHARVLQMQTAINPGNSGGPVLDDTGSMIGLVAMSEEGQNLDYAIAADVIQRFLQQGFAVNTRGVSAPAEARVPKTYIAKAPDDREITKWITDKATVYWISNHQTKDSEIFILDRNGNMIHGTKPNKNGGFAEWSAVTAKGNLKASSEGRIPQVFERE